MRLGPGPPIGESGRRPSLGKIAFVGFDVSTRILEAIEEGKIQGTVAQNPFRMGRLGVRTVVDVLEGRPVEAKVTTGETLVTPENLKEGAVAAVMHPPKADGRTRFGWFGGEGQEVAGDGDPQGDDA